jgi:spore maturation protein CgeB
MSKLLSVLKRNPVLASTNARLKAWLAEHDAAATRNRYQSEAARRGRAVPQGEGLTAALTTRIGGRRMALGWPKAIGDLHLFLPFALTNWEAVLPKALAPFGEVTVFEWKSRGFEELSPDWVARRDHMNREMAAAFAAANRRRPVDVVVGYLSGNTVSPALLRDMASQGAVITNFCFDDKIAWPGPIQGGRHRSTAGIAAAVDLNLTSDPQGLAKYWAHGGLAIFHPEAADPECYRPLGLPFRYEVSFVGARYGWRPRLIDGLERRGITVECFGKGWPKGAIANDEMNALYAASRINLGFGGIGYSRNLLCLKGRDFEVPMSGALYLTQDNPELAGVFEVGREILTYGGLDDCARVIRSILEDPDHAQQIRDAGRARCLKDHTYAVRWAHVLRTLGALS